MQQIDNDVYNRMSATWWDENSMLSILRTAINPVRFGYFSDLLDRRLKVRPQGMALLDVGCGGGFLSEEFARIGFDVTGVDPSDATLQTASQHAKIASLKINYLRGSGENLPFHDRHFDVVVCCDVLEHVRDVGRVISEISRVLKPCGTFFYDTINRTPLSRLVMIKLFQDWKPTAILPRNLHVYEMFIRPEELKAHLTKSGLEIKDLMGMEPEINPLAMIWLLLKKNRGMIDFRELGEKARFKQSGNMAVGYMGYAQKT